MNQQRALVLQECHRPAQKKTGSLSDTRKYQAYRVRLISASAQLVHGALGQEQLRQGGLLHVVAEM